MKLLTTMLILISFNVSGQKVESVEYIQPVLRTTIPEVRFGEVHLVKPDTIKVMMLITDTSTLINGYIAASVVKGYNVLKLIPAGWEFGDRQIMEHWEHDKYLDDKKKPLKKSIIVWQSKAIK